MGNSDSWPGAERLWRLSADWLFELLCRDGAGGEVGPGEGCQALLGCWIADCMIECYGGRSGLFSSAIDLAAPILSGGDADPALWGIPTTLTLLVGALLRQSGVILEPLNGHLVKAAAALNGLGPCNASDINTYDKRVVLHRAGLLALSKLGYSSDGATCVDASLNATALEVDEMLLQIEVAASAGTRDIELNSSEMWLQQLLAGMAMHRFRHYDLRGMCRILRVLEYLGAGRLFDRRSDLFETLAGQQRVDGSFGWFGPEEAELRKLSPGSGTDVLLYLPTTVESLWALAEGAGVGWRLFRSIGGSTTQGTGTQQLVPEVKVEAGHISPAGRLHQYRQWAESFGSDPERYDRARPRYPRAMVDRIVVGSPGLDVLDVGCGTGIAARQFQAADCRVLGVEVDARMADLARRSGVEAEVAAFEAWDPAGRQFDAVISGQAWHWVDATAATAKAAQVLRPGGRLAAFWNLGQPPPDAAEAFSAVYRQVKPGSPAYRRAMPSLDGYSVLFTRAADGIRKADAFGDPEQWRFEWERSYTRDEWLDQLPTHGDHTQLPPAKLEEVLAGIGAAIDAMGGTFTMRYTTVAVTATRADAT